MDMDMDSGLSQAVQGMTMEERMHASVGMAQWEGQVSFRCTRTIAIHASIMVAGALILAPLGVARLLGGGAGEEGEERKRTYSTRLLLGAGVVSLLGCFIGVTPGTISDDGEPCFDKSFLHAGLGWLMIISFLISGGGVLIPTSGILLTLTGIWAKFSCFERETFYPHEIGHLGPAMLWIFEALLVLPTAATLHKLKHTSESHSNNVETKKKCSLLELQCREGYVFMLGASIYFLLHILDTKGGMLAPWTDSNFEERLQNDPELAWHYTKDQQHGFQALVWLCSGLVGIMLQCIGYKSGIHFFFASIAQAAMIFFHPQINPHAAILHKMHAIFLVLAAISRAMEKLVEFSLLLTISMVIFISSSSCMTMMASASSVDEIGYLLFVIACAAAVWGYFMFLFFLSKDSLERKNFGKERENKTERCNELKDKTWS